MPKQYLRVFDRQGARRKHFTVHDPARISRAGLLDEESCKISDIQAQVTSINGMYTFFAFLPALFFTGPYRQLAKVREGKVIMFMNIGSFAIDSSVFITVCKLLNLAVRFLVFALLIMMIEGYYHTAFDL
jgi:hypothetical protein